MTSQRTERNVLCNLPKLVSSKKYSLSELTDSKQVCDGSCLLTDAVLFVSAGASEVVPDSHNEPGDPWINPQVSYDNIEATSSRVLVGALSYSSFLEYLLDDNISCTAILLIGFGVGTSNFQADLDYWDGLVWVNIDERVVNNDIWTTFYLPELVVINKIRLRIYNVTGAAVTYRIREIKLIDNTLQSVSVYDGFSNDDKKVQQLTQLNTGTFFGTMLQPVYCAKGLYIEFDQTNGNFFLRYLKIKDHKWFTLQTSQLLPEPIRKTNRWQRWYRLLRVWFTK